MIPTLGARTGSDESVTASQGSITQIVKNIFSGTNRDLLLCCLLAISVTVNILAVFAWRDSVTHTELKRYDLDFFKQNDWATLKSQVETNKQLIEAYGLQKAVKDAAKEK